LNKKIYNDGDEVENYILSIYKNNTSKEKIDDILNDNPSWPVKYHLSSDRHNLLSWYNFKENSSLLEIGAGCGAITGLFLDKGLDVTAVELSKRRADIIRTRFRKFKNLEILNGDINDKEFSQKFDYATLIGVLEYAGKYGKGEDPFLEMIRDAKKYLKKGGVLIIAIGNRFGLKYWRGVPEDHTNILFDSLEGYPKYIGVRTFGKLEITKLIQNSNFEERNINFYYPLPDYKFCYEVFSENYLPNENHSISRGIYPSPHPIKSYQLFFESLVAKGLQKNNIFDNFANSFLIFCTND
jgi:SAM-dependent methyltransferase